MSNNATLTLPDGSEIALDDFDVTLGELITIAGAALNDSKITPDNFGISNHFFFVKSTEILIDAVVDLRRSLSNLGVRSGDVVDLRLCKPDPQPDGSVLNPMYGVTKFVK